MKKILVATDKPFAKVASDGIREIFVKAGYSIDFLEKYTDKADLLKAVATAEGLIIRSDIIDAEVLAAAPNLKIVVRAGAGYDNIDTKAAADKGVVAMNTPGQNANAVAELAFGMMVYMARNLFTPASGSELRGKSLGIHAFGNIGRYMAEIGKGFGMKIYAFDPFVEASSIRNAGVEPVSEVKELYKTCQYVSLHMPATAQTKGSINYDLLSVMPQGAVLVNTARKEVICEDSLLRMFASRPDFRYLSDIEPDCKAEMTEKYAGKYYFTPKKMGAQTEEANINAGLAAANQIVAFFEKGDIRFKVN